MDTFYSQCFAMDKDARHTHAILNQIIVGIVLMVDVSIRAKLDASANIYNHQNCTPNNRPGNMMAILVIKAQASTIFVLVQYSRLPHFFETSTISIGLSTLELRA